MKLQCVFTPQQRQIIRDICDIQIDSLHRVYNSKPLMDEMRGIIALYNADELDVEEIIISSLAKVKKVQQEPDKIFEIFDQIDLRVVNHILFNWNKQWEDKYPIAIQNLWSKIVVKEDIEETQLMGQN